MSNSYLSTLICRQAKKYGDRIALKYRDYETESWISVSWNQFAEKVNWVSNALIALGAEVQENIGVFFSEYAGMLVYGFWCVRKSDCYHSIIRYEFGSTGTLYIAGCWNPFFICGRTIPV